MSGVDALVLETHTLEQAEWAVGELCGRFDLPIVASLYDWPEPLASTVGRLIGAGADVVGMNCGPRLDQARVLVARLREVTEVPIWVKPGRLPGEMASGSDGFAEGLRDLVELGARCVGGCCGTTEADIRAVRRLMTSPG